MADQVIGVTIKGIGDFSDVVSNVGAVQKALTKLKLPDKLGDNLSKNISNFMKEYEKYQKKVAEGIHTQGDQNAVNKSLNSMINSYEKIIKDFSKISSKDFKEVFNLDDSAFASVQKRIKDIEANIKKIKLDPKQITEPMEAISKLTSAKSLFGEGKGLNKLKEAFNTNDLAKAKEAIIEIQTYYDRFSSKMGEEKRLTFISEFDKLKQYVATADAETLKFAGSLDQAEKELADIGGRGLSELDGVKKKLEETERAAESVTEALKKQHSDEFSFNRQASDISRQIQSYFGLSQMIRKVGDIAKDAFQTVKELDKAMTETAVVTNFSVGDMWEMLPTYTQQANQLGSTIRDVYEAATLYYQQGLNTNQAMSLANETLKMARIAGLDAADATNMMTAALRGFNMEINQTSAQKINDVYSELAAITASDTREIGSAMERTASIANSANMEFATTSAFLAQMIETTREAPENLGTAMKTIVARFQEMKQDPTKLIDSEGVAMDANKVDKALKTIGVQLMNTKGEFRDLDDVFLDISAKWDSLTQGQQRYIATIAAGSRQQSRFIAMMSNYERTMELVDAANNSAGASQRQFEKTLDSMEAKLNKLKNAWDQFTMGLMNNQILKFGVDALTEGFTILNKFIDLIGKITPKPFEGITKSILTLVSTIKLLQFGGRAVSAIAGGTLGWLGGDSFKEGFSVGWGKPGSKNRNTESSRNSEQQGFQDGQAYGRGWTKAVQIIQTQQKTGKGLLGQSIEQFKKNKAAFGSDDTILKSLFPNNVLDETARANAQEYLNTLRQELRNGTITKEDLPAMIESGLGQFEGFSDKYIEDVAKGLDSKKIKSIGTGFNGLTGHVNSAGVALSNFGMILQNTPLEPFGQILTTVGTSLISLSTTLATTKAGFLEQWAAATAAAMGTEAEGVAAMTAAAENGTLTVSAITAAGGMATLGAAIWTVLWPLLAVAAIIGTVVGAYKLLDAAITTNKEKLETASDAAAAASEAYDSAKQETSELADAIEQIKTNEDAFDGLVVGTAAFNEQLVTANDQIMELIKKYPMLNDYLTTDKNGLMHISDEGLNQVKEYQKQRQANASALNLIQTADLNNEESRQKAKQMRRVKGTDTTESYNQRLKEADLVKQQAKAQAESAKFAAVNTALVDKEIGNREKVSAIMADQYDARKKAVSLEGESIHDLKQEYADFYGYKYDKSTKKLTDIEGNEIDVDNKTIKDAVKDIRVIADLEFDAGSVDTAISSIDQKFSKQFKGSNSFFSDILSDNIETNEDLLRQVLQNPQSLENAVKELSSNEIAAVLGVSADVVDQAPEKYRDELTDKIVEKASNIAESQSEAWGELGAMLAQSQGAKAEALLENTKGQQDAIRRQLTEFNAEQRDILVSAGKSLEASAGTETMKTFIRNASSIYKAGTEEVKNELSGIIEGVNWDSPIARLKAYKDLTNSTTPAIHKMGEELMNSAESANLIGEAFEEFYNSSDWAELSENMDSFVDSNGKLNAASVEEMAKQCHSLNNLLDTGAISAGGVAAALNALGSEGDLTLLDLNSNVLKLLTSFNQLDDAISSAHRSIENFDWGIDTGEAEDFVKDSAKKWNELYNNGEFGNPQLEAYAKYVLGEENYIKILQKNNGDLEATMNDVAGKINHYADGFDNAWNSMAAKGTTDTINGKEISMYYDKNGDIIWDPGTATTNELIQWLEKVQGISEDMAKVMLEDWENYSPDFRAERQKNDFQEGLKTGGYVDEHRNAQGGVTITQTELDTIAAATGQSADQIKQAIADAANIEKDQLNVLNNIDQNSTDYDYLNKEYSKSETGSANESWIKSLVEEVDGKARIQANDAISKALSDGFTQAQAENMAYEELSKAVAEGTDVWYKDKLLTPEDLASFDNFKNAIAEFEENSQWVEVGKAIAEGVVSYIKGETTTSPDGTSTTSNDRRLAGQEQKTFGNESDQEAAAAARARWSNLWQSVKEVFTGGTPTEDPKVAAAQAAKEKAQSVDEGLKEGVETPSTADPKSAGEKAAREGLNQYMNGLNGATPSVQPTPKSGNINTGSQTPQSQETTLTVHTEDSELDATKAKIDTVVQAASQPQTLTITANTGKSTDEALNGINKIKDATKGSNTISVNAKVKGKEDVSNLNSVITNIKPKTINVTASVSGASKVTSLKNEISNLKDKDVYITTYKTTVTRNKSEAKGRNNKISSSRLPSLGSLAGGTRYGRLGPKGKGGLTLTGEEGFEIAWLPDESRSMILGVDGPQMINLPANAVVYTHEQSEDILKKRQEIEAGSHSKRKSKKSKSSSKSKKKSKKKSKGKSSKKDTTPTINNWSIEEAVRYNIDQSLASITEEISLRTKEIEKNLEKIGTTYNDIVGTTQAQIAALEQVKQKNQELLESNQRQLADYRAQQQYVSWTDANGESQRTLINIASYLNADGSVNTGAIQSAGGRALQEAIYREISSAKSIVDGINNANKAIQDADEKIAELGKKISEAFYQWENELTEVYDLTQRINNETSLTDRFASQIELELAQLGAGFGDTATAISNMRKVLNRNNTTLKEQLANQEQMIHARRRELELALDFTDEVKKRQYFESKGGVDQAANIEYFKNLEEGAILGYRYVKDIFKGDLDGSLQYRIDWEQFRKDNETDPYTKDTYERIKNYLDALNDASVALNDSIKDTTDLMAQTYNALREYQDYIVDVEDTLIKGVEEEIENAKNNAKQLSDSITNALKDLLDEVKRKLDERRKQEDNAKTERDISQKQQRLAALRADTSGGHQVEIAQLEKEIADSQQSYQRTLEDQLLDRLQQQADAAAQQRERQIELAETSNQIAAANNKELVDMWLKDPITYKEQIRDAWLEANGYDEKGEAGQYVLRNQFESDFAKLVNAVSETDFQNNFENLEDLENDLVSLLTDLTNGEIVNIDEFNEDKLGILQETTAANVESILTEVKRMNSAAAMKAQGIDAGVLKTAGYSAKDLLGDDINNPIYSVAELQKAGYKASELMEAGVKDIGTLKGAGYTVGNLKEADVSFSDLISQFTPQQMAQAFNETEFKQNEASYALAVQAFGNSDANLQKLSAAGYTEAGAELTRRANERAAAAAAEAARRAAEQAAWNAAHPYGMVSSYSGTIDKGDKGNAVRAVQNALNRIMGAGLAVDGSFGDKTKKAVKNFQKAVGITQDGKVGSQTKGKFAAYGYKTGGLADYTGPAWLDGTPSKPELVLNPTDTKNFLALRDVLSSAMKSTGSVNNSYGGDATYEININVDHLNNDYDVDRVAERVKKIIVKDSSYRNVTQVRNLR